MAKSGKRAGRSTPPRSLAQDSKESRLWWWVGGALIVLLVGVAAIWLLTRSGEATEEVSSMPENPADRNDMYDQAPAMQIDASASYEAKISTEKGEIVAELDASAAPRTVNNFVFLARQGFYDGLTFHRVEPGFVIQGGDPLGTGGGGPGYTVPAEIELEHVEGAIAMARMGDQVNPERASSGSQFYITLDETPHLDGAYTVFGEVVEGMDVVEQIAVGDEIESITIEEQ